MDAVELFSHHRWLVTGLALLGGWLAFQYAIVPVQEREDHLHSEIASLQGQILGAQETLREIEDLQTKLAGSQNELRRIDSELPDSPALVWIPEHLKQHFAHAGFAKLDTKVKKASDEPKVPGYQRLSWSAEIPMQSVPEQMGALLVAIADLEQTERVVRAADIAFQANIREPQVREAVVNFSTLVRKE